MDSRRGAGGGGGRGSGGRRRRAAGGGGRPGGCDEEAEGGGGRRGPSSEVRARGVRGEGACCRPTACGGKRCLIERRACLRRRRGGDRRKGCWGGPPNEQTGRSWMGVGGALAAQRLSLRRNGALARARARKEPGRRATSATADARLLATTTASLARADPCYRTLAGRLSFLAGLASATRGSEAGLPAASSIAPAASCARRRARQRLRCDERRRSPAHRYPPPRISPSGPIALAQLVCGWAPPGKGALVACRTSLDDVLDLQEGRRAVPLGTGDASDRGATDRRSAAARRREARASRRRSPSPPWACWRGRMRKGVMDTTEGARCCYSTDISCWRQLVRPP